MEPAVPRPQGPVVVRRALGGPRDLARVSDRLTALGVPCGDRLGPALGRDDWGLVLLAERRGTLLGLAVVRWLPAVGAAEGDAPATAWVERLAIDDDARGDGVHEALADAVRAEAEARGVSRVLGLDPSDPEDRTQAEASPDPIETAVILVPPAVEAVAPAAPPSVDVSTWGTVRDRQVLGRYVLVDGVELLREVRADTPAVSTLWSGAQALRTRWRGDRMDGAWSRDECLGSLDAGGDVLRFDPDTLRIRETYLVRAPTARIDAALWEAVRTAPTLDGTLSLDAEARAVAFEVPSAAEGLFDVELRCLAGLTAAYLERRAEAEGDTVPPLEAVPVSSVVSLLFSAGRYVGWRALNPIVAVRPMGWPEVRESPTPDPAHRDALVALLHAWMTVDAQGALRPDEVDDPSLLAPMLAVRDQARALAALDLDPADPIPGVARDIAADVHWRWGFFRLGD